MKKITILLTFISLNVYSQKADWKTYTHDNYSIQYPSAWELEENQVGTIFALISPVDTANPNFNMNVNLVIQDLKGQGIDLDKYTDISIKQIKQYLPNDSILIDEKQKDGTGEYMHLIYMGDENSNHLQFEQYYRIINDKAYILTFTALQKQWDKSHRIGGKILNSFSLKQ